MTSDTMAMAMGPLALEHNMTLVASSFVLDLRVFK